MSKTPFAPEVLKHKNPHFSTLQSQFIQLPSKIVTVTFSTVHRCPPPSPQKTDIFMDIYTFGDIYTFLVMTP
jgi:hypothetical protein